MSTRSTVRSVFVLFLIEHLDASVALVRVATSIDGDCKREEISSCHFAYGRRARARGCVFVYVSIAQNAFASFLSNRKCERLETAGRTKARVSYEPAQSRKQ